MGTLGEYFVYYLFYTYFLYYLTDYVLVPASVAGVILTIVMLWDACTDPIVGYLNDCSKNPKGRKRPLMAKIFIPFAVIFALCFIRLGIEGGARSVGSPPCWCRSWAGSSVWADRITERNA